MPMRGCPSRSVRAFQRAPQKTASLAQRKIPILTEATAASPSKMGSFVCARWQTVSAGSWAFPALINLIGNVRGQDICDLGCGEGRIARLNTQSNGDTSWQIQSYFAEGFWSDEQGGTLCSQVGAHHRMLSTYLNNLIDSGYVVERMVEPQAPAMIGERNPAHKIVPFLLLIRCSKAGKAVPIKEAG